MTVPVIAKDDILRTPARRDDEPDVASNLDLIASRARTQRREGEARRARAALRDQIARLESELSGMVCSEFPLEPIAAAAPSTRRSLPGASLCDLAELERRRDELAERVAAARAELEERGCRREEARTLREEAMQDPASHRWLRVTNEEIGEPGCKQWHVRPRLGLLGMLMGWWRVRISSGCPLAKGRGPWP
jgi:DNA repair exonuclease SbcCD ATPase subunit